MSARARRQSIPIAASAACVGVEQLTAATSSSSVRSVWWPDRGDHRHPEQRDRAAEGLVAEAQQVGQRAAAARDDRHLDLAHRGQIAQRADDRRRGVAILHGGEAPDEPPGPPAAGERGEDVVARLAALAGDHADRARQQGQVQAPLALEQPLGVERLAQAVDPREQISLAGHAQVGDGEGEAGGGGGAARVEVAAARHHHLHALDRELARRPAAACPLPRADCPPARARI